jgi:hypothetical protein
MEKPTPRIPAAAASDSSEVTVALEAAATLLENGDAEEAVRWLRRAADAAGSAGDDLRAVALASAAADLKDALPAAPEPAPPSRPGIPPIQPTQASPRATPPPPPSARAARPAPAATTARPGVSRPPPPPSSRSSPASAPPPVAPAAPAAPAQASDGGSARPAATEAPLRVAVKWSVRDPNLFMVRVLPDGQPVPPGSHEAFLTPAAPGIDLRRDPRRTMRHG